MSSSNPGAQHEIPSAGYSQSSVHNVYVSPNGQFVIDIVSDDELDGSDVEIDVMEADDVVIMQTHDSDSETDLVDGYFGTDDDGDIEEQRDLAASLEFDDEELNAAIQQSLVDMEPQVKPVEESTAPVVPSAAVASAVEKKFNVNASDFVPVELFFGVSDLLDLW